VRFLLPRGISSSTLSIDPKYTMEIILTSLCLTTVRIDLVAKDVEQIL
jgi:hypothetical protein